MKDNIFGTSSESELEQGEDRDVSGSAVASSKKRAAPDGSHEKTEAMKHYQANPGLSYPMLIEWCFKKI